MSTIEQTTIPAGVWALDPVHSKAAFAVKYSGVATFRGHFSQVDAELRDGTLTGSVDVSSVEVPIAQLKGHLQAPDFFDAEQHPHIAFTASDLAVDGERLTVRGELTIKGTTRPLEATGTFGGPYTGMTGAEAVALSLETVVNRHDFGISWNADLPTGGKALADDVTLTVDLVLTRAEA